MAGNIRYDDYVKAPNLEWEYTPHQIRELNKCKNDVLYFISNYIKIVSQDHGVVTFIPYDYQVNLLKNFVENRFNVCLLSRQSGKALSLDTPIPIPDGKWSTMGELSVGDMVLSPSGNPVKIISTTETMDNHDCYELEFDTGEKITADKDHLWVFSGGRIKNKQMTTHELLSFYERFNSQGQGVYVNTSKPINNKKKILPIDPYVLGVWLGDGSSYDSRIAVSDVDYYNQSSLIERCGHRVSKYRPKRDSLSGGFNIYGLHKILRENNLLQNKHIPREYFSASTKQRLDLVRGLMDTDGSCGKRGSNEFYNKNNGIIEGFRELLFSLGIKNRIREKIVDGETYYIVSFTTRRFYVYNLERKRIRQQLCKNHPQNGRHYIKSIKKVDSVLVRCIMVDDPNSMFLCGRSMIPTHNSTIVAAYALWFACFHSHKNIGVVSNKAEAAKNFLGRLKYMYELLPVWLKPGVPGWAQTSVEFDNHTKLYTAATSKDSFRGEPMGMLICVSGDNEVTVRDKITGEIKTMKMVELEEELK